MARRQPTQPRSRVTVAAIVEASARVLLDEGYAALTTKRVAVVAGVSVGTLYQYFRSRDDLVDALVAGLADERIGAFATALEAATAGVDDDLETAVRQIVGAIMAAMRVRPEIAARLAAEGPRKGRPDLEAAWQRRCVELMRAALYQRRAHIRPGDLDLIAHVLVHAAFAVLSDALRHRPELLRTDALREELVWLATRYLEPAPPIASEG
jgi:AcrR family transcriptional regulator